jgi:sulfur carrier protein
MMKVKINGTEQIVDVEQLTVKELLVVNKVQSADMVSVQLNGLFVQNKLFENTYLKENDEIDFLYFMGGGSHKKNPDEF